MSEDAKTYTYRAGEKIELRKQPNQFVVRALPPRLEALGLAGGEQVSSASTRVTTRDVDLEASMSRSRHLAPTHHAYRLAETGEEFLITDRIFVHFKESDLPAETVDAFAGKYGLLQRAKYSDRDYLFQLTQHTGMNPVKLVVLLTEQEPLVAAADHDLNVRARKYALNLPTDTRYGRQWHLHTQFGHPEFDARSSARCEDAWRLLDGFGNPEVVVAVSDDGCKLDHGDFNEADKFAAWGYLRGSRLVTNADIDANPQSMYTSGQNHGTSCAGVIAAEADAALTVGAAPGCRLLPIQWESDGPSLFISGSKLLTVLDFIADKADIMSNSWGGVPDNLWPPFVVSRIGELARTGGRRGKGILFLWAAGNENCPIQHQSNQDVPYTDGVEVVGGSAVWVGVRTSRRFRNNLVGVPGVLHIAALASIARRSHYSNYGTGIALCAPSSNIHEYHRLTVQGLGITTATGNAVEVTDSFGGTSSATPLVAGVAALTLSANPELSALELASLLRQTASKDLDPRGYPRTPSASFDADTSWDVSPVAPFDQGEFQDTGDPDGTWSPWFGHGRVDAARAVAEARKRAQPDEGETGRIRAGSTPGKEIPDFDAAGITDAIQVSETGSLVEISVSVDITHTYRGDLRVRLVAPSGDVVPLHERAGGGSNDLKRTFDLDNTPGLAGLAEQEVRGEWTLRVQDLARVDTGRLNEWALDLKTRTTGIIEVEETPGAAIPDNTPTGITRELVVQPTASVRDVAVTVDITHTYIRDLRVSIVSPSGTEIVLHNRQGGSADNIITTYKSSSTPGLNTLKEEPAKGTWKLKAADLEGLDKGKLNRWALRIDATS